jgi:universal stress protein A
VPTDFSDASQRALMYALMFARSIDGALIFVNVVEPFPLKSVVGQITALHARGMDMWLAYAHVSNIQAEAIIRNGEPSEIIPSLAKERKADYIIMGVRGGDLVNGTRLHSKLQDLVRRSPCPVLSVYAGLPLPPSVAEICDRAVGVLSSHP